jgi:hypothetical protein
MKPTGLVGHRSWSRVVAELKAADGNQVNSQVVRANGASGRTCRIGVFGLPKKKTAAKSSFGESNRVKGLRQIIEK